VKIELSRDWSEFLRLLISHRVRFVLIGGHAVAGHGEPRLTEDLDVFPDPTLPNGRRLLQPEAGAPVGELPLSRRPRRGGEIRRSRPRG
jgi:hypothetical protein